MVVVPPAIIANSVPGAVFVIGLFGVFLVPMVLVGLVGVLVYMSGRKLRDADADTVGDAAAGGEVSLLGTARAVEKHGTIEAPISGERCLVYWYRIQWYKPAGVRGGQYSQAAWRTSEEGDRGVPFALDCEDGTALVQADRDPHKYNLSGGRTFTEGDRDPEPPASDHATQIVVENDEEPPERIRRFLAGALSLDGPEPDPDVDPADGRRRYLEYRLVPGEETFVTGVARDPATTTGWWVPEDASAVVGPPDVSGKLRRLVRQASSFPFVISDTPPAETASGRLRVGVKVVLIGAIGCLFTGGGVLIGLLDLLILTLT